MSDTTLVRHAQDALLIPDFAWAFFLTAAEQYGWLPLGTNPPEQTDISGASTSDIDPNDWAGDYFADSGQTMLELDVANCRHALIRALRDKTARDGPARLVPRFQTRVENQQVELIIKSARQRRMMRDLIAFMSRGEFVIYCGEFSGAQTTMAPGGYIIRHSVDLITAGLPLAANWITRTGKSQGS